MRDIVIKKFTFAISSPDEFLLSHVDLSSTALTRASMLRSSHPLCNAGAQNEGGDANFCRFVQKIGYHSNVP